MATPGPFAETLVAAARDRRARFASQREAVASALVTATALAVGTVMAARIDSHRHPALWVAALATLGCAVLSRVEFEVGPGAAVPTQLALVPMLFLLPVGAVPLAVAAAYALGALIDRRPSPHRALVVAGSAWHAVGPALVIVAAGEPSATRVSMPVMAAAFAAQMASDLLATCGREWLVYRGRPSMPVVYVAWAYAVDAALTPIALFAAIAADTRPELLLGLAPLALLLLVFARERTARIDRVLELQAAYRGTALMLGDVIEGDDGYTGEHSEGVVTLVLAVARELGLGPEETRLAEFGALLHDIGKIRVPKEIINKPGPLTAEEFDVVKAHPVDGQRMLDRVGGLLGDVGIVVRSHHERVDGTGYPDGLVGDEIPLLARVIAVCDTFSAITTTRPYRGARSVEAALAEIRACAGSQLDPVVVAAMERAVARLGPGALLAPPSHMLDALSEAA